MVITRKGKDRYKRIQKNFTITSHLVCIEEDNPTNLGLRMCRQMGNAPLYLGINGIIKVKYRQYIA